MNFKTSLSPLNQNDNVRCKRIISTIPGVIYDYVLHPDGTGQFLYVSPQSAEILGVKNYDIMTDMTNFYNIIYPEDIGLFYAIDRRANKEGKSFNLELRIITPSGEKKWVYLSSLPNPTPPGELVIWSGVILDITDLKKLEEELKITRNNLKKAIENRKKEIQMAYEAIKVSEEKYRDLVENANTIIIKYNKKGEILFFNEFAEKFFGFKKEEIIGKNILDTIVPHTDSLGKDLHKLMEKTIKSPNEYSENENENVTKSGKRVWVSWRNKGLYNHDGDLVEVLSIGMDNTLRKKIEIEREQLIKDLRRSNRELENFAYITSHDLQEPLRSIASYAQLIKMRYKGKLDDDADAFIDYMIMGSKRMKDMIKGLLQYSRLNIEEKKLNEVDMNLVLEDSLSNLKYLIEESNAIITSEDLPILSLNKETITLVFQNIIGNSIKFSKKNEIPLIHISASKEGSEYLFKFSDNGIGMDSRYNSKIFNIFSRLHPIGEYDGVGIGLAVCRRIVEEHNGHIWVESELGKGSTFYFTIGIKKQ